ncbi:MAG: flagellar export protein FliJ [Treponema sp.]|jgi:flagellar FliJ protein|nr:flagellar export protein FliJ [Treponema sp.]
MKKFKFNLEKIMQLRKFKEEECKIALGQAISILNNIENEIKATALKRFNAAEERFNDPLEIASWDNYILRLEQTAERLTEQAAQAEMVVEEKRALYMEASKDLKAIEKLKDKQKKDHRKEMFNYQMSEVDDITAARYVNNEHAQ